MQQHVACRAFFQRVMDSPKGCAVEFDTKGAAINFRQRCYSLNKNIRLMNKKVYQPDEPMYGKSEFDAVSMVIEQHEGKWRLVAYATPEAAEANMRIIDL